MKPKRVYEAVLWDRGEKSTIGFFHTKKEAQDVLRLAKQSDLTWCKELPERIYDGCAGFAIIPHDIGISKEWAWAVPKEMANEII